MFFPFQCSTATLKPKSYCFVFTSSFKNNDENKNIRKNLFHSILLNFEYQGTFYTVQVFLDRDLKIQKLISGRRRGGDPNNNRGVGFFFQKIKRGPPFIRDLRVGIKFHLKQIILSFWIKFTKNSICSWKWKNWTSPLNSA